MRGSAWFIPALAVVVACAAVFAGETWIAQSRRLALSSAAADQSRLARSIEARIDGLGRGIEFALGGVDLALGRLPLSAPLDDSIVASFGARLHAVSDGMVDVCLIDADGRVHAYSASSKLTRLLAGDGALFALGMASAPGGLVFGMPVRSRVDGRWSLPLVWRLEHRRGKAVLAVAVLDSEALSRFIARAEPGRGDVVTLLRSDGGVLGRWPDAGAIVGQRLAPALLGKALGGARHGNFVQGVSPFDGQRRLISYIALDRYPVTVAVSAPLPVIMARSEREAPWVRAGVFVFVGFEWLALTAVWRLLNRLHGRELRLADVVREKTLSMELLSQRTIDLEATRQSLERLSVTDPLTGLHNRRHFIDMVERTLALAQDEGRPLTLLYLDIDHFKRVNDNYGHVAGDVTLQSLAVIMRGGLRPGDDLARIGGEEFAILLPETGTVAARAVAERVRGAVETARIETEEGTLAVTVSIGAAVADACDTPATLLKRADGALYQAKLLGRNRVIFSPGCDEG